MNGQTQDRDESFYRRLRWRTALTAAAIYLIPFSFFYGLVDYISVRHIRSQIYGSLQAHAAANADLLDDVLGVRLTEVKSLAQALSHTGAPLAQPPAMLREFVDDHPWYWLLAVADATRQITTASGDIRGNIQDRDYFRQALGEETVISDVFVSPLMHKAEVIVASALREGENQIMGVLAAALRLDKLNSSLLNPCIGETGESLLANAAGQLVASSPFTQQALT